MFKESFGKYLRGGPILREHGAMLRNLDSIPALYVGVDEAALAALDISITSDLASVKAPLSIKFTVAPSRHTHVGVYAVAVKRDLDSSAILVLFYNPVLEDV